MIDRSQVSKILNSQEIPSRHSLFQLNFFILGKEPTHQAKLKKCVEELKARNQSVIAMENELDDLKDRNDLLRWEMSNMEFMDETEREIKCRMADRKVAANNRAIDDINERLKAIEEEMLFFVEAFTKLNQEEPIRNWDDLDVQTEYWNAKLMEEINHRLVMRLPLDVEIIRTVLALPDDTKIKKNLVSMLKSKSNLEERR